MEEQARISYEYHDVSFHRVSGGLVGKSSGEHRAAINFCPITEDVAAHCSGRMQIHNRY